VVPQPLSNVYRSLYIYCSMIDERSERYANEETWFPARDAYFARRPPFTSEWCNCERMVPNGNDERLEGEKSAKNMFERDYIWV